MAAPLEVAGGEGRREATRDDGDTVAEVSTPSSRDSEDPWLQGDPWQHVPQEQQRYANWSDTSSRTSSRASSGESYGSWHKVDYGEWAERESRGPMSIGLMRLGSDRIGEALKRVQEVDGRGRQSRKG